jgi:uncharacterized RDD family membrane protein YckC
MSDGLTLAGRFRRLIATLVDVVLVPTLTLFLVLVTGVVEDADDYVDSWWVLHVILLAVLSYLILNGYGLWRHGQTLGKKLMGIAIVSAIVSGTASPEGTYNSNPAPLWKLVCVRALFFPLLFLIFVPFLAPIPLLDQLFIFGKRRRCLHDFVSGTVVVRLDSQLAATQEPS